MPEPPETVHESVSPDVVLERLDILCERHRTGLMTASDFNAALHAFQFRDPVGHLWSPGVNTRRWYRWDRDRWTEAPAPPALLVSQAPVLFTDLEERMALRRQALAASASERPQAAAPAAGPLPAPRGVCPQCGAANPGKKFCTRCGTKLS